MNIVTGGFRQSAARRPLHKAYNVQPWFTVTYYYTLRRHDSTEQAWPAQHSPDSAFLTAHLNTVSKFAGDACIMPNTHRRRRRDATKQFHRVGVGGVYWALSMCTTKIKEFRILRNFVPDLWIFGLGNGSPSPTNVVLLVLLFFLVVVLVVVIRFPFPKSLSFLNRSQWNCSHILMTIFCIKLAWRIFDLGPT